jgi:hypothetical protein
MVKNNNHPYKEISSFEDFRLERQRLILKGKLIEAKINMEFNLIREVFSFSNVILSFAKEFILPYITDFLSVFSKQDDDDDANP